MEAPAVQDLDPTMRDTVFRDTSLASVLGDSGLAQRIGSALNVQSAVDLLHSSRADLERRAKLSKVEAGRVMRLVSARFAPQSQSLERAGQRLLSWGCPVLDTAWGGGLRCIGIVEIAGPASSGKTQCAMQLTLSSMALARPGSGAVWISTEAEFPVNRFVQIGAGMVDDVEALLPRLVLERALDFEELWDVLTVRLPILARQMECSVLVIDSIGSLRSEYDAHQTVERAKWLWRIAAYLKWFGDTYDCAVIVLNQVTDDLAAADKQVPGAPTPVKASLGLVWSNCVNTRIMLRRTTHMVSAAGEGGNSRKKMRKAGEEVVVMRRMTPLLCPYLPPDPIPYLICQSGVKSVPL